MGRLSETLLRKTEGFFIKDAIKDQRRMVSFESRGLMMNCLLKVDNTIRDSMNVMNPTDNSQFRLPKKCCLRLLA